MKKLFELLFKPYSILGLSSAIACAGVSLDNNLLTTVSVNSGITIAGATYVSKQQKEQENKDRGIIETVITLKEQVESIGDRQIEQEKQDAETIQVLKENNNKIGEENILLCSLVSNIQNDLQDIKTNAFQQQEALEEMQAEQQKLSQKCGELHFDVGNAQKQARANNKKIKKQEAEIRTQKTNAKNLVSKNQKLDNKCQQLAIANNELQQEIQNKEDRIKSLEKKKPYPVVLDNKKRAQNNIINISEPLQQKRQPRNLFFIDGNNLYNTLKTYGIEPDYKALFVKLTDEMENTQVKLYDGAFSNQKYKYAEIKNLGFQVVTLPIKHRDNDRYKTTGDDVQLAIDMVKEVRSGDRVTLVSGDGDFFPALREIRQQHDVSVSVIASKSAVSEELLEFADNFINLESIMYDIAKLSKFTA